VGLAEVLEAAGDRADRDGGVEHLVVVGERLGDGGVVASQAQLGEAFSVRGPQRCGRLLQRALVDATGPARLDRLLQLAAASDAGVAEDRPGGEGGHDVPFDERDSCSSGTMPACESTSSTVSCWLKA